MKRTLIILSALLCLHVSVAAQTFSQIISDPMGDNLNGVADIKTVSYAMDLAKDSIWFKVETYNPKTDSNDFGLEIGLDTDMNINNGTIWDGSNKAMKYDHALFITQNSMFPGLRTAEIGTSGSTTSFKANITRPDKYTWVINAQLSKLDKDHKFNIIVGGAFFDCPYTPGSVYDDAPNTGYKTITAPAAVPSVTPAPIVSIYPNPVKDHLIISSDAVIKGQITVYDLTGRVRIKEAINQSPYLLPVGTLTNNIYLYRLDGENGDLIQNGTFSVCH